MLAAPGSRLKPGCRLDGTEPAPQIIALRSSPRLRRNGARRLAQSTIGPGSLGQPDRLFAVIRVWTQPGSIVPPQAQPVIQSPDERLYRSFRRRTAHHPRIQPQASTCFQRGTEVERAPYDAPCVLAHHRRLFRSQSQINQNDQLVRLARQRCRRRRGIRPARRGTHPKRDTGRTCRAAQASVSALQP